MAVLASGADEEDEELAGLMAEDLTFWGGGAMAGLGAELRICFIKSSVLSRS